MDSSQLPPPSQLPAETLAFARQFFDYARKGDVEAFRAPLAAGLPPGLSNDKGDSFLMLASYYGHVGLVKLLLEYKADPK